MNKCSCQACGGHIEYPPEYEGMEFACPHCGQGTRVQLPQIQVTPTASAPAPPPMGSMSPSLESAPSKEKFAPEPDPHVCENCGGAMAPEDKVCMECGHRRPFKTKWTGNTIFRMAAGVVLLGELAVLGLQWTTEGKPFGLRQRTRSAVLVKVGLREELDPAEQAALVGKNVTNPAAAVAKDPDLKLKSHELKPDQDNGSLWIRGVVKNISKYRYYRVKVRFKMKDKEGNVIPEMEASAYQQAIDPGKEWDFKALMIDPDAVSYEPIMPIIGNR